MSDVESILESEDLENKPSQSFIGGVLIDTLVEEKYRVSFEASTHPIQSGASITDFITDSVESITLTCIQGSDEDGKTWLEKYDEIIRLCKEKEIIDIITSKHILPFFAIVDYSDLKNRKQNNALFFTVEARKINIVSSSTQKIKPELIPKEQKVKNKKLKPNPDDETSTKDKLGKVDPKPLESDLSALIFKLAGG